jgi:hypothetical protein
MAKIQGEELLNGLKTIKTNFKIGEGSLDCHLWLLPEKNYLPMKFTIHKTTDGGKIWAMYWSKYKELARGIWYPTNIKMHNRDMKDPVTITIEEMDISPLTKEDFEFKFPAFTHVTDHLLGTSYLTTTTLDQSGIDQAPLEPSLSNKEKEEVLDKYLENSEPANSKGSDVIGADVKPRSEANLEEESSETPYWVIMLAFILVVGGIILIVSRRKNA